MDVSTSRDGTDARVVITGDVDSETSPQLEAAFDELLRDGVSSVTVDATDVAFLSSAGLSVLITAHRNAERFRLEPGNRIVDRLITLTGLTMLYGDDAPAAPAS